MNTKFQAPDQRAERLIAMGQMAASMAHEIRNPLGSMELFCTLLKKDLTGQPELYQLAEQMHESIKVLDRIIANCLEFTRDRDAKWKRVESVRALLQQVALDAQPKAQAKGVRLQVEEQGDAAPEADPYLIKQALLNLVFNAIDAAAPWCAEHGRTPEVVVHSDTSDPEVWKLTVADNGPGISEDVRERVFEPFYTTKDEGTGLGLAIVHSLVSAHRGTLTLDSAVGQGTTVRIGIPQPGGATGGTA